MATIQVSGEGGQKCTVRSEPGQSLMEVLRDLDLVLASCGGHGVCGTCHVYLDAATYAMQPPPGRDENDQLLQLSGFRAGSSRLACQLAFDALEGAQVSLAGYH